MLLGRVAERSERLELVGRELPLALAVQGEPVQLTDRGDARRLLAQRAQPLRCLREPFGLEVAGRVAQPLFDLFAAAGPDGLAELLAHVGVGSGALLRVSFPIASGRAGRGALHHAFGFVADLLDEHPLLEILRRPVAVCGASPRLRSAALRGTLLDAATPA